MSADAAAIVAQARAWVGVPFAHQGRSRVGVDCAGLVIVVARELGLVLPEFDVCGYGPAPDGTSLRDECERHMRAAPTPAVGGVVLLAWAAGPPQHLGFVAEHPLGGLSLIHAEQRRARAVVEHRLVFSRAMRLVASYRLPGVD